MKRDLRSLAETRFDVLVVGGGITGACIAWDAALRGLNVALIEAHDFGGATSANCLKIVHGGLRYLQRLDVRRVRQSIRERSAWLRLAPHLVEPLPCVLPTSRKGLQRRTAFRAALAINDALGWDRNDGLVPERRLPPSRLLSRDECRSLVPDLDTSQLTGGVLFHDAVMYSAERLVLEVVRGAVKAGVVAANYVALEAPLIQGGRVAGVVVGDGLGASSFEVRARVIVNATGAGVPATAALLTGAERGAFPPCALALNLVLPAMGHRVAFAVTAAATQANATGGRRKFFVVPWRDRTLIGTGQYACDEGAAAHVAPEPFVSRFVAELSGCLPGRDISEDDIKLVHLGIVPSAGADRAGGAELLGHHRILDHGHDGTPEVISVTSVKYTTARRVAEETVDLVYRKLGSRPAPCRTETTPLPGAPDSPERLLAEARASWGDRLDDEVITHLVRSYGRGYHQVLSQRNTVAEWDRRVVDGAPVIRLQLVHAARHEMACTTDDLLARRTELGARGLTTPAATAQAREVLESEQAEIGLPAGSA